MLLEMNASNELEVAAIDSTHSIHDMHNEELAKVMELQQRVAALGRTSDILKDSATPQQMESDQSLKPSVAEELKQRLLAYREKLGAIQRQSAGFASDVQLLRGDVKSLWEAATERFASFGASIEAMFDGISRSLQASCAAAQEEGRLSAELRATCEGLQKQLESSQAETARLSTLSLAQQPQLEPPAALRSRCDKLVYENIELQEEIISQKSEFSKVAAELEGARAEICRLESAAPDGQRLAAVLRRQIGELEGELRAKNRQIARYSQRLEGLESDVEQAVSGVQGAPGAKERAEGGGGKQYQDRRLTFGIPGK